MVPFCPFWFWGPLLNTKSRKKGALIIKGLLENLVDQEAFRRRFGGVWRIGVVQFPIM